MGLDVYLKKSEEEYVEFPSEKHPSHLFKIGYFRSSYNSSGFNNVAREQGIKDLYDVFDPGESYEFKPDWEAAREVALEMFGGWQKANSEVSYTALTVMHIGDDGPGSEREAVEMFLKEKEEKEENKTGFRSYSSRIGCFVFDGIKVMAAIPGETMIGTRCTYLISEVEPGNFDWYLKAAEIVVETIDYILEQPDTEEYYLAWSS